MMKRQQRRFARLVEFGAAWMLAFCVLTGPVWAGGHERLDERTAEQQELANRFLAFIERMEDKYFGAWKS